MRTGKALLFVRIAGLDFISSSFSSSFLFFFISSFSDSSLVKQGQQILLTVRSAQRVPIVSCLFFVTFLSYSIKKKPEITT